MSVLVHAEDGLLFCTVCRLELTRTQSVRHLASARHKAFTSLTPLTVGEAYCSVCNEVILSVSGARHLETAKHKNASLLAAKDGLSI
jgi:hypothetical protein